MVWCAVESLRGAFRAAAGATATSRAGGRGRRKGRNRHHFPHHLAPAIALQSESTLTQLRVQSNERKVGKRGRKVAKKRVWGGDFTVFRRFRPLLLALAFRFVPPAIVESNVHLKNERTRRGSFPKRSKTRVWAEFQQFFGFFELAGRFRALISRVKNNSSNSASNATRIAQRDGVQR